MLTFSAEGSEPRNLNNSNDVAMVRLMQLPREPCCEVRDAGLDRSIPALLLAMNHRFDARGPTAALARCLGL